MRSQERQNELTSPEQLSHDIVYFLVRDGDHFGYTRKPEHTSWYFSLLARKGYSRERSGSGKEIVSDALEMEYVEGHIRLFGSPDDTVVQDIVVKSQKPVSTQVELDRLMLRAHIETARILADEWGIPIELEFTPKSTGKTEIMHFIR
jgi:hypothetical protein